jgi:hypothetical protein
MYLHTLHRYACCYWEKEKEKGKFYFFLVEGIRIRISIRVCSCVHSDIVQYICTYVPVCVYLYLRYLHGVTGPTHCPSHHFHSRYYLCAKPITSLLYLLFGVCRVKWEVGMVMQHRTECQFPQSNQSISLPSTSPPNCRQTHNATLFSSL